MGAAQTCKGTFDCDNFLEVCQGSNQIIDKPNTVYPNPPIKDLSSSCNIILITDYSN